MSSECETEMFEEACRVYGTYIGSKYAFSLTTYHVIEKYNVDEQHAKRIVQAAFNEWMDAYR
jgi:hypothetical protein